MKKKIKSILVLFLVALIVCATITVVFAEAVFYYFGYRYTYINNDKVSIYDVDEYMTDFDIPATLNGRAVVDIRNRAFQNHTDITAVDFSGAANLERIGAYSFSGCTGLSGNITVPSTVNSIGDSAFENCSSLDSVSIEASINTIPYRCFMGCSSLRSVSIVDTISSIEDQAFANCLNLSYMEIPKSVTAIANTAFLNDDITLGVYTDSYAHQFAVEKAIPFILLDAPEPTEPPTEPEPTNVPTEPVTEAPTAEPTQPVTEVSGYYLGDVNGDKVANIIDATYIQRYLASLYYPPECVMSHGNVDGDSFTTILDATMISRYVAQFETPYPIGEWVNE